MIVAKLHKQPNGTTVLALCDKTILGKRFEDKGLQLDLSSSFYKGEVTDEKKLVLMFKSANIINLAGKKSVKAGINAGIVDRKKILFFQKIPHAVAVRV